MLNTTPDDEPILLAHDHSELDELLAAVFSALATGKFEQSFESLDIFWARLAMHIRAEHLHLFPALLGAVDALEQKKEVSRGPSLEVARSTIAQLQEDHDFFMRELTAAIKQLRELRDHKHDDEPAVLLNVQERIIAVSRRLEAHNALEESQVYRWAGVLLAPQERIVLNESMQKELGNLPPRFSQSEEVLRPSM